MMRWLVRLPWVNFEEIQDELEFFSKVTLDRNESFATSQNWSYTTLFSHQQRQNKAKLAYLTSEYQFSISFRTFAYVLQSVPSPTTVPKMLVDTYQRHLWETAMMPVDARGVAGNSWATNKSPSARSTAVAFYPRVTRGVIYISAGKAVVLRI